MPDKNGAITGGSYCIFTVGKLANRYYIRLLFFTADIDVQTLMAVRISIRYPGLSQDRKRLLAFSKGVRLNRMILLWGPAYCPAF